MKFYIGLTIISVMSVACSPKFERREGSAQIVNHQQARINSAHEAHVDEGHSHDPIYTGLISEQFADFYLATANRQLSTTCDVDLKDIKIEIGIELDKRKDEILKFELKRTEQVKAEPAQESKKISVAEEYKSIDLGSIELEDNIERTKNNRNAWKEVKLYSWIEIVELYKKIKSTPIDEKWVKLDKIVRKVIKSDQQRIVHSQNLSLRRQDEAQLKQLISISEKCLATSDCYDLKLSPELEFWAASKMYYPTTLTELKKSNDVIFKEILGSFLVDLKQDYKDRYEVLKLNHIVDKNSSTITIHLDLSAFAPDEKKAAEMIENFWSKKGLIIKVNTEKSEGHSYFKFVSSPLEVRASVNYETQELKFASGMSIKRVMHEFGHILGLNDQYFTIWDEKSCSYSEQYNDSNLMSSSDRGVILNEHVNSLREVYFGELSQ